VNQPQCIAATSEFFNTIGHKQPFAEIKPNVRFPIRKQTFEPIVAAQDNLFVG
jgi:hypothetical protein